MAVGRRGVVWDVNRREFDFGFLFESYVAGRGVSGESVFEILLFVLLDEGGKRDQGGKNVVIY